MVSLLTVVSFAQFSMLEAAPKTNNTLEAIWTSKNFTARKPAPVARSHQRKPIKQARKASQKPKKYTKKQYQQRFKLEQELKLNRQRAAWRKKWEAEQRVKQIKLAQQARKSTLAKNPVRQTKPVFTQHKPAQQQAPKQLTRAQYQAKWKLAQQKKQQATGTIKHRSPIFASRPARTNNAPALYNTLPFEVKHKLRSARINEYGMSAYVQDVNARKPLLAHRDTASRVPASVMKLITSYAALGTLGPNYRWPLEVYTRGPIQNGTLRGDLIIKGYGSPEFNRNELRKVLHGIRAKGIRNVQGRLVFDNSHFSIPRQSAGAFDGKAFAAYNAQPDALLYNERISSFQVSARGKHVRVSTTTPAHNLKIVNRMRKSRRGCRPRISISRRGAQVIATFSGRYSSRCGTRTYNRVISQPSEMIYGAMKAMWKRDVGGRLDARFAMGKASGKLLLKTYSRTLAEILPTIDKESNNVMARQLLLTVGAKRFGGQGTPRKGAEAVSAFLRSRGLHFPELRIENGSGLSRHARISARHVGDLLVDAYKSPYRNVLMRSLAVAGVDGTMKRRLRGTAVRGRGFFKTGTLRDVRSIAGYVKASNGKTYAIAILHNDPKARRRGLAAHDKLIEWVYGGGRSTQIAMR
jgi:D-alanyl-D-alanine carboxypeptidase/D-alanyl-D-alanine-endopeptidase (penicillin-binding protein 4)